MNKLTYIVVLILGSCVLFSCKPKEEPKALGSLCGTVIDKNTSNPIKNAGVELQPIGLKSATGSDGFFEFPNVEEGSYYLYVTKSGYNDFKSNEIHVIGNSEPKKVDVHLEPLPPALQVVDDSGKEINTIDFGDVEGDIMRSFNIFNNSEESLEWEIIYESDWINSFSKNEGVLLAGRTQTIVVKIDRSKLLSGQNSTVVHIVSDNGSKQLAIRALSITILETLAVTEITPSSAVLNGKINKMPTSSIVEYGFVYGTMPTPSLDNGAIKAVVKGTAHIGTYSYAISELTNGETYFVRAFAKTEKEEYYGETQSFTAQEVPYVTLISAKLMVQKTNLGCVDRSSAIIMCESSIVGGYDDWRLPSIEELMVVYNERNKIGGLYDDEIGSYYVYYHNVIFAPYWSISTTDANDFYFLSFEDGTQKTTSAANLYMYVRAVRTIE